MYHDLCEGILTADTVRFLVSEGLKGVKVIVSIACELRPTKAEVEALWPCKDASNRRLMVLALYTWQDA